MPMDNLPPAIPGDNDFSYCPSPGIQRLLMAQYDRACVDQIIGRLSGRNWHYPKGDYPGQMGLFDDAKIIE